MNPVRDHKLMNQSFTQETKQVFVSTQSRTTYGNESFLSLTG